MNIVYIYFVGILLIKSIDEFLKKNSVFFLFLIINNQ